MKSLYGLDLGNGDIKVMSNITNEPIVFPSVIGKMSSYTSIELGSNNKLENLTIYADDNDYAVGKMALKNSNIRSHDVTDDKYLANSTRLLASTAISLTSEHAYSSGSVVIGLPIHKMDIARDVASIYKGQRVGAKLGYFGEYETKTKIVLLDKVAVVAQPHGTLFNLILDDNGKIQDKELASKGIAIFDIGYKTNDGIVFKALDPIGRLTIHSKNGMHVAYEEIRRSISAKFGGLEIQSYEVPDIIATGRILGSDIRDIISQSFYNVAMNIINEIKTKWEDAWEIEQTVFTGGGAQLLKNYLIQAFPNAIFHNQTSNAKGFLKYAKRLWGEEK